MRVRSVFWLLVGFLFVAPAFSLVHRHIQARETKKIAARGETNSPGEWSSSFIVQGEQGEQVVLILRQHATSNCEQGMHMVPPFAPGVVCVRDGLTLGIALVKARDIECHWRADRLRALRKECGADNDPFRRDLRPDCPVIVDI